MGIAFLEIGPSMFTLAANAIIKFYEQLMFLKKKLCIKTYITLSIGDALILCI